MDKEFPLKPKQEKNLWVCFTILAMLGFVLSMAGLRNHELLWTGLFLLFLSVVLMVFTAFKDMKHVSEWKLEVMNALPVEKKQVFRFSETGGSLKELTSESDKHIYPSDVSKRFLQVNFVDKNFSYTLMGWFEIHELTEEEPPYIEYQQLPYSLNSKLIEGYYHTKLYIPRGWDRENWFSWTDATVYEGDKIN